MKRSVRSLPRLQQNLDNAKARSILINIGELKVEDLHRKVYEDGLAVNRDRRDWSQPGPNP